jgi:hypothetical protein
MEYMKKRYLAGAGILLLSVCAVFAVTELVYTLNTTYNVNAAVNVDVYYDGVLSTPAESLNLTNVDPGMNSTYQVWIHNLSNCNVSVTVNLSPATTWAFWTDLNGTVIMPNHWQNGTCTVCPPSNTPPGTYDNVWTFTFKAV